MTIGYGESSFRGMVELAAGWLIAAYQIGYGLAAFGGGALQRSVSLPTLYRLTAVLAVVMGLCCRSRSRLTYRPPGSPILDDDPISAASVPSEPGRVS